MEIGEGALNTNFPNIAQMFLKSLSHSHELIELCFEKPMPS